MGVWRRVVDGQPHSQDLILLGTRLADGTTGIMSANKSELVLSNC